MSNDSTVLRLVVLYADVSGSTRIYEEFGDQMARSDIAVCLELLSDSAAASEGRTIKTIGDEVMCVFSLPSQACEAAAAMQQALDAAGDAGRFRTRPLEIKIGWHYGAAEWRGEDLIGEAPTVAQQIIGIAKAREILTSEASLAFVDESVREAAQPLDTLESAMDGSPVAVFKTPWEEGEEVTRFRPDASATEAETHRQLIVLLRGGDTVRLDEVNRHCTIGRTEDNDVQLGGRFTSRHHARIDFRHGRFYIRDDSINGTLIKPNDGPAVHLHREEGVLDGEGVVVFGAAADEQVAASLRYFCS